MVAPLVLHESPGEGPQLIVDQGQKLRGRPLIPVAEGREDSRNVGWSQGRHQDHLSRKKIWLRLPRFDLDGALAYEAGESHEGPNGY